MKLEFNFLFVGAKFKIFIRNQNTNSLSDLHFTHISLSQRFHYLKMFSHLFHYSTVKSQYTNKSQTRPDEMFLQKELSLFREFRMLYRNSGVDIGKDAITELS